MSGEITRKLDILAKLFKQREMDLYLDTTIGQFKNFRKLKHHTGLKKHLLLVENQN